MYLTNTDQVIANASGDTRQARRDALLILDAALQSVNPTGAVEQAISRDGDSLIVQGQTYDLAQCSHIYLIGVGKASVGMTQATLQHIAVDDGAIITTTDATVPGIQVFTGTHPYPSPQNMAATRHLLSIVDRACSNDLLIALISGGGSSLLCQPRISLKNLKRLTQALLRAGCTIQELNTVRKHLSLIKGGQLATRCTAPILSLIISDVLGNPLDSIASGPTASDSSTFTEAEQVLRRYELWSSCAEVQYVIQKGAAGLIPDTPKHLDNVQNVIIANNEQACQAAAQAATEQGYYAQVSSTNLSGAAQQAGQDIARYICLLPRTQAAYVFGGETTVAVTGHGHGGRNQELALAAVPEIDGERIVLLTCGTDGIDGDSPAAGAIADGQSLQRAASLQQHPDTYLQQNDSYTFFNSLNDTLVTGHTGTNVMDLVIALRY